MHHNPGPPSHSTYPPPQSMHERPEQMPIERSPLFHSGGSAFWLALLAVVVLAGISAALDAVPTLTQGAAQTAAVRQFCADEVSRNYTAAYTLLAPDYIATYNLTSAQFVSALQQRDQREGAVQYCVITGRDNVGTFFSFGGGAFHVVVALNDGRHTGTITLVNDRGWKVRYLDTPLHLDN